MAEYVGPQKKLGPNPVAETGDQDVPTIVQQGTETGRTIYVQFTGDSNPSSPVAGDIRFVEA